MLIFLHLPKTGGTTLTPILDWNYGDKTYKITRFPAIQKFIDLPDDKKREIPCLQGQIFYGIHAYIPQPCTYITMMRHPVKRLISQYQYIPRRQARQGETVSRMSMEYFLEVEPFQAHTQLNLIAGGATIDEALRQPLEESTFARARANIERDFAVVGLVNRYDESLLLMKQHFGWKRAFYARQNVNEGRKTLEDFPAETQKRILAACEPEMELYHYVQQRLEEQLQQQDAGFWAELEQLRRTNQRFQQMYRLAKPIRHSRLWFFFRDILRHKS